MVRISGQDQAATAGSSIAGGFVLVSVASPGRRLYALPGPSPLKDSATSAAWLACHRDDRPGVAWPGVIARPRSPSATSFPGSWASRRGVPGPRPDGSWPPASLEWSNPRSTSPILPIGHPGRDLEETLGGGRGPVIIPRRMLRFLAERRPACPHRHRPRHLAPMPLPEAARGRLRRPGEGQGLLDRPRLRHRPPTGQGRSPRADRARLDRARGPRPVGHEPLGTRLPDQPGLDARPRRGWPAPAAGRCSPCHPRAAVRIGLRHPLRPSPARLPHP